MTAESRIPSSVEGRPLEDAELTERARGGDVRAYEELVERYRDVAYRTAYLLTGSAADAEDAAQDAFVKAYYAMPRFRADAPFRPWILRIVSNEARNRRRSSRRREGLVLRLAEGRPSGDAAPSPEATVLSHEMRDTLVGALSSLREGDREVIAYRYFLDLSESEMAVVMGCRRGTVKSRLARAMDRLRASMPTEPTPSEELELADG